MSNRIRALLAFAALALAFVPSPARAETYRDEKLGYSFNAPSKWLQVPVDSASFLLVRFNSKQEYEWQDARGNFWTRHCPWLKVLVIPKSVLGARGATVEKTDEGVKIRRTIPWKSVKEFLDVECRGIGGYHFVSEDETTLNGLKVRRYEVAVDKNVSGERIVYGWEYETEDALFGMTAEILAQEERKLKPEVLASFASFRTFNRTGSLPTYTNEDEISIKDPKGDAKKEITPEQMKKKRDDAFESALARAKASLPKDWSVVESKNFTAVSHADARFTKEILQQAEALRAWLEQQLGYVGSGPTGKMLIRIAIDGKEYSSMLQSRGWFRDDPEVWTYRERDGVSQWYLDGLNQGIYYRWLKDKNQELAWGLPRWISWGLSDFVGRARLKNGRLDFKADVWDSVEMKQMRRSDSLLKPRDFFQTTSEVLWNTQGATTQTQFFVNFLMEGLASRSSKYRNVLSDYIKNLIFVLDSQAPADPSAVKEPQNEQEEAEMLRQMQESFRKEEQKTLDTLLEKTFGGWTDADWNSFNALYRQDLK